MKISINGTAVTVPLEGSGGRRSLPLTELYRLPGSRPDLETVLEPGELITAVELPPQPFAASSTYRKVRDRASNAFLVSVAATLDTDAAGMVRDVRLALGGVAPKPWRAWQAEAELAGAVPLPGNAFKVGLVRRTVEAVLLELAGAPA